MTRARRSLAAAALALLPMGFALAGGWLDERAHLGFSNWRSVCRAGGLTAASLVRFTLELLPGALAGALLGMLAVQLVGAWLWRRGGAHATLCAHAGCAFGMVAGLVLCARVPSLPLMLASELLLAGGIAMLLCRWYPANARLPPSVRLRTRAPSNAY